MKLFFYFSLILLIINGCAKQSVQDTLPPVVQLNTYLVAASENGQKVNTPILPGTYKISYINDLLVSLDQAYDNLQQTYGYSKFTLKGETRDLIIPGESDEVINTQLDTVYLSLRPTILLQKTSYALRVTSYGRHSFRKELLNTEVSFPAFQALVLGLGQSTKDGKRSALFIIIDAKPVEIQNKADLKKLWQMSLPDLVHQWQAYRAEKAVRQKMGWEERKDPAFENLYPFYGVDVKPKLISKERPQYPEAARKQGVEGVVVVSIIIDETGSVQKSVIFKGVDSLLDRAAKEAAARCRFEPAVKNGKPVKTMMNIPFRFRLQSATHRQTDLSSEQKIVWPQLVKKTEPELPENFDRSLLPDGAILNVLVDVHGRVQKVKIVKNSRSPLLDRLAVENVRRWQFTPGKINGETSEMWVRIPFRISR